jgi:hypothetical protein
VKPFFAFAMRDIYWLPGIIWGYEVMSFLANFSIASPKKSTPHMKE